MFAAIMTPPSIGAPGEKAAALAGARQALFRSVPTCTENKRTVHLKISVVFGVTQELEDWQHASLCSVQFAPADLRIPTNMCGNIGTKAGAYNAQQSA
jgi:hypothetical protein